MEENLRIKFIAQTKKAGHVIVCRAFKSEYDDNRWNMCSKRSEQKCECFIVIKDEYLKFNYTTCLFTDKGKLFCDYGMSDFVAVL